MEKRFREMETQERDLSTRPPLYLVIDETADLFDCVKGSREKVKKLLRLSRAACIHLILATQAPSRKNLSADVTLNIPCRVALRCETAIESRQVLGCPGAEMLPQYGYCLVKTPSNAGRVDKWKIDIL